VEVEELLRESLEGESGRGVKAELRVDFRRLVARFECVAGENEGACLRFQSGRSGCAWRQESEESILCLMAG
jgi:hypothetical protein